MTPTDPHALAQILENMAEQFDGREVGLIIPGLKLPFGVTADEATISALKAGAQALRRDDAQAAWNEVAKLLRFGEMTDPWVLLGAVKSEIERLTDTIRHIDPNGSMRTKITMSCHEAHGAQALRRNEWSLLEALERELDASEPRPLGGQHVGPMASHWVMNPTTRKAMRNLLRDWKAQALRQPPLANLSEADIRDLFEILRYVQRDPHRLAGVLKALRDDERAQPEAVSPAAGALIAAVRAESVSPPPDALLAGFLAGAAHGREQDQYHHDANRYKHAGELLAEDTAAFHAIWSVSAGAREET